MRHNNNKANLYEVQKEKEGHLIVQINVLNLSRY